MAFTYKVSYGTSANGPWTQFGQTVSTLFDTVTGLTSSTAYYFQIITTDTVTGLASFPVVAGPYNTTSSIVESVEGFSVTTAGPITYASQTVGSASTGPFNAFVLVASATVPPFQISMNGGAVTGANVTQLYYHNHALYQHADWGTGNGWWYWDTTLSPAGWTFTTDPTVSTTSVLIGAYNGYVGASNFDTAAQPIWNQMVGYLGFSPHAYIFNEDITQLASAWPTDGGIWSADAKEFGTFIGAPLGVHGLYGIAMCDPNNTFSTAFNLITSGAWDSYYVGAVNAYATAGYTDLRVRPGWEMNMPGFTNWCPRNSTEAAQYVAAFKHIYTLLHSSAVNIPVKVSWCPGANFPGTALVPWTSLFPGAAFVDIISIDIYGPPLGWAGISVQVPNGVDYCLQDCLNLCNQYGKPFSAGEVGGGADSGNPLFATQFASVVAASGVTIDYLGIWDANVGGSLVWSAQGSTIGNAWGAAINSLAPTSVIPYTATAPASLALTTGAVSPLGWTVDFFDDFNGTMSLVSTWGFTTGALYHGVPMNYVFDNVWGGYNGVATHNISLSNSNINCPATFVSGLPNVCSFYNYWGTNWGLWEASIKCAVTANGAQGLTSGFWLSGDPYGDTVEIDVFETATSSGWQSAIHNPGTPFAPGGSLPSGNMFDGTFHTHQMLVTPAYLAYYIDGVRMWTSSSTSFMSSVTTATNPPRSTVAGNVGFDNLPYNWDVSGGPITPTYSMIMGVGGWYLTNYSAAAFPASSFQCAWFRHSVLNPATGGPHV